jgi:peptidoglycan hydrolase-like protein with peptidoglycan-binding domain
VFDPGVVDAQLGTAVILRELMDLDSSIKFDGAGAMVTDEPDDELARSILWLQQALNKLGADPVLTEDGQNGPRTMAAVSQFQQKNGLQDTGLADAATIATIQRKLTPVEGGPVVPSVPGQPSGALQLLALILTLLSKEKSMAGDFTKSGQEIDPVNALLPLLLQSLFSGKQIDITQLLAALLTGRPMPTPVATPSFDNTGVIPPSLAQPDLITILLPLIFERLTGKPLPGTTPVVPTPGKPTAPPLTTVNGALGQTVGNMLNGRKTAIGAIGLLATTLLPVFFPQLAPIAAVIKPALGAAAEAAGNAGSVIAPASVHAQSWGGIITDVAQPLFAALTGWGVLGKFDKWFNRVPQ